MLGNMLPRLSMDNTPDGKLIDTKLVSKRYLCFACLVTCTNSQHFISRKFDIPSLFTSWLACLGDHIRDVLSVRAKPEMLRIDALSDVARMADFHALRDRTIVQLPREAMDQQAAPTTATCTDCAVPVLHQGPSPQPTGIGFLDTGPEPISQWCERASIVATKSTAGIGTKSVFALFDLMCVSKKKCATLLTNTGYGTFVGHRNLLTLRCIALAVLHTVQGFVLPYYTIEMHRYG